jgi:hypothetical protein
LPPGPTPNGQHSSKREDREERDNSQETPERPLLARKGPGPEADERQGDNRYRETDQSNEHVPSSVLVHENDDRLARRANQHAAGAHGWMR